MKIKKINDIYFGWMYYSGIDNLYNDCRKFLESKSLLIISWDSTDIKNIISYVKDDLEKSKVDFQIVLDKILIPSQFVYEVLNHNFFVRYSEVYFFKTFQDLIKIKEFPEMRLTTEISNFEISIEQNIIDFFNKVEPYAYISDGDGMDIATRDINFIKKVEEIANILIEKSKQKL